MPYFHGVKWQRPVRWAIGSVLGVVLLLATAGALLHIPVVQSRVAAYLADSAGAAWGLDVQIGATRLAWWRAELDVEEVHVKSAQGAQLLDLKHASLRGWQFGNRMYFSRIHIAHGEVNAAAWAAWSEGLPAGGSSTVWHIDHLDLQQVRVVWETDTLEAATLLHAVQIADLGGTGDSLYATVTAASGSLAPVRFARTHLPAAGPWNLKGTFQLGKESAHVVLDTLTIDRMACAADVQARSTGTSCTVACRSSGGLARWVRPWLPHALAGAALDEPFALQASALFADERWEVQDIAFDLGDGLLSLANAEVRGNAAEVAATKGTLRAAPYTLSNWLAANGSPLPDNAAPWMRSAARHSSVWSLSGTWNSAAYEVTLGPEEWKGGPAPRASVAWNGAACSWRCENLPVQDALPEAPVAVLTASGTLAVDPITLLQSDSVRGDVTVTGVWSGGQALGPFATSYVLDISSGIRASGTMTSADARAAGSAAWDATLQEDGTWTAAVAGAIDGLQVPHRDWRAFGTFEAHAAHEGEGAYAGGLALRTITLLERGAPLRFERFDVHGKLSPNAVEVEWMSDLTSGNARATADLPAWQRWWEAFSNRAPLPVPSPELGTRFTVTDVAPLALLLDVPLKVAPGTVGRARVHAGGIELALTSNRIAWEGFEATGIDLHIAGDARALAGTAEVAALSEAGSVWASQIALAVEADSTWRMRAGARDPNGDSGQVAVEFATDPAGNRVLRVPEAAVPVFGMDIALEGAGASVTLADGAYSFSGWRMVGPGFALNLEGTVGSDPSDALVGELDVSRWPDLEAWGVPAGTLAGANVRWEACGFGDAFEWTAQVRAHDLAFREFKLDSLVAAATGGLRSGYVWTEAFRTGGGRLGASGKVPFDLNEELDFNVLMDRIPLDWTSVFLPAEAVTLSGDVSGQTQLAGTWNRLQLAGSLEGSAVNVFIPSLGTNYVLNGQVDIEPGMFALDNWRVRDDRGREGRLTATVLHTDFGNWNFDANLTAPQPFHLMELTRTDNDLFYGSAFATGDVNVSGNSDAIAIEARLKTEDGTTFALPLDAASDVTYGGGFLSFRSPGAPAAPRARDFIKIKLNLGIEVTEAARARIIFDEAVGDEIVGKTKGNLKLDIDDFERFTMNGDLEVVEGSYLFTLENVISKRFTVVPGGRLRWFGDPYAADIDLVASYRVRTRLNELLPSEPNLPGRTPVDLRLGLKGNLLAPGIHFSVDVPDAEPRIQALVESALANDDELNRQAVSLLVLGQFFNPDPAAGAVGPASLQNSGTGLLASQLSTWISSLTGGVDVGLDYGADPLSGQQALAVALSTRLLDDRLQLEGAFGTNRLANTPTQDLQIQDIRVSYDLGESGRLQVTGYTQTTPTIPGQDGRISQGVGIRMRRDFHHLGELWEPRSRKRSAEGAARSGQQLP